MICNNCGTENENGCKFCAKCGAALSAPVETTYASPAPTYAPPVNNAYNANYNYATQNPQPAAQANPGKGLAIAGMVCGILSFFCFAYILGTLGIIFGAIAKNKGCRSGMATAGIVCGVIGVGLWLLLLIMGTSVMGMFGL